MKILNYILVHNRIMSLYSFCIVNQPKLILNIIQNITGWQSNALQIASKVENLTALAFPDFNMDRFVVVMPIISASSLLFTLRLTSLMSKFTFMDIV